MFHIFWVDPMIRRSMMLCMFAVYLGLWDVRDSIGQTATVGNVIPYGESIRLSEARKVIEASEVLATKENWPVAIAIVDTAGHLVAFAKLDNTQLGSIEVAIQKAKTAALYRRSTKEFEDRLGQGGANVKLVTLPGIPIEGGLPLVVNGKLVGAIGVSGVQSSQDGQIAAAGLAVVATIASKLDTKQ
jgi:glc operon protein GlcG